MIFKEGGGWKACYDEERNLYTAGIWGFGQTLYEITRDIFEALEDGKDSDAKDLISRGRKLFMDVNDRCGPPYTIVFDDDFQELCPWAEVSYSGKKWPKKMVDAVVEVLDSEKANREQRRKKRKAAKK